VRKGPTRSDTAGLFFLAFYINIGYIVRTNFMSQVQLIQLKNKETGEIYWSRKNKRKVERKIELKKYSKLLKKHVSFKEAKK
jgi:ribosomal protein L33